MSVTENFYDGSDFRKSVFSAERRNQFVDDYEDESLLTAQLKCLEKIDNENGAKQIVDSNEFKKKKQETFKFRTSKKDKQKNFSALSVIWLIIPVLNLLIDTIYDLGAIIIYLFRKVFNEVYKVMVPGTLALFGSGAGVRSGKKYCIKYDWFRYFILILCPPAGVFMAIGIKGWFQILICCVASLFFYFPGLAYAIIVINRSEVNSYMKYINNPSACNSDGDGMLGGLFISDQKNINNCKAEVGQACIVDSKDPNFCCAKPRLVNGVWMRKNKIAEDRHGNPISNAEQGAVYCRNDTEKIKSARGLCVWKESGKPS